MKTYRLTRYEIAARHPDGRALLIGYTPRNSRPGLLAAMRRVDTSLIDRLAISDTDSLIWHTKPRPHCVLRDEWTIGFTGRTQVEACNTGELMFVAAGPHDHARRTA
jgi:hypothetical protein